MTTVPSHIAAHTADPEALAALGDARTIDPSAVFEHLCGLVLQRDQAQMALNTGNHPTSGRKLTKKARPQFQTQLGEAIANIDGLVGDYRMLFGDDAAGEMAQACGITPGASPTPAVDTPETDAVPEVSPTVRETSTVSQ